MVRNNNLFELSVFWVNSLRLRWFGWVMLYVLVFSMIAALKSITWIFSGNMYKLGASIEGPTIALGNTCVLPLSSW